MNKRIAVIITNMFDEREYKEPVDAFLKQGHSIENVGFVEGEIVKGKKNNLEVTIDKSVKNINPDKYDALLIPGGFSPDILRADDDAVQFVKYFMDKDKPVFTICHGAQLLINADSLKGRTATGYKSIKIDMINAGVNFIDDEVVIDNNLVSSRTPLDMKAFIRESLKKLSK